MSTVSGEPEDWNRVAGAINDRMRELGWDQADLVRQAGLSDATVRQLQRGEKPLYRRSSLRKVSVALLWPPDGIERLAEGATVEELQLQAREASDAKLLEEWAAVGQLVAARRSTMEASQDEVARDAGVPLGSVVALESGLGHALELEVCARIAGALDLPADAIAQLLIGADKPRRASDLIEVVTSERMSAVERRLDALESKVDGMDVKLDRLLGDTTP